MAILSSSIARLPCDSPESLVSSETLPDPLPSSSSSLIPSSIRSSPEALRLNCGSRLRLFDFFEASFSEFVLESVGRFESIEPCSHVS